MPGQNLAHLRQFRRADGAALNNRMLEHGREYAREKGRSPEQNEKILRPVDPAHPAQNHQKLPLP